MTSSEIKIVPKGWGYEKWIVNTDEYCGKLLHFIKGKKCSWHYHKLKDETFYLQEGKLLVKYSDNDNLDEANEVILERGDKFHVYRGLRHQMFAMEDTDMFEFSTQHFDSDSHRIIKGD
jgi:quercetin dioxygenase-like cupin family protein|tara:strand:- start:83 stop:439 length:357 start_codon:yes stop_codon:yes gene_type:complete